MYLAPVTSVARARRCAVARFVPSCCCPSSARRSCRPWRRCGQAGLDGLHACQSGAVGRLHPHRRGAGEAPLPSMPAPLAPQHRRQRRWPARRYASGTTAPAHAAEATELARGCSAASRCTRRCRASDGDGRHCRWHRRTPTPRASAATNIVGAWSARPRCPVPICPEASGPAGHRVGGGDGAGVQVGRGDLLRAPGPADRRRSRDRQQRRCLTAAPAPL